MALAFLGTVVEFFQICSIQIIDRSTAISGGQKNAFRTIAAHRRWLIVPLGNRTGQHGRQSQMSNLQVLHRIHACDSSTILTSRRDKAGHKWELCPAKDRRHIGDEYAVAASLVLHIEKETRGALGMTGMVQHDNPHISQFYWHPRQRSRRSALTGWKIGPLPPIIKSELPPSASTGASLSSIIIWALACRLFMGVAHCHRRVE